MTNKSQKIILSDLNLLRAESELCIEALKRTNSLVDAAELLGINRHALRRLIAKHNIVWWLWAQKHESWVDKFEESPTQNGENNKIVAPGEFSANSARTVSVSIDKLYAAWFGQNRNQWLKTKFKIRSTNVNTSIMINWSDGTNLEIYFREKGESKSQIYVIHRNLEDFDDVSGKKDFWVAALDRLQDYLS